MFQRANAVPRPSVHVGSVALIVAAIVLASLARSGATEGIGAPAGPADGRRAASAGHPRAPSSEPTPLLQVPSDLMPRFDSAPDRSVQAAGYGDERPAPPIDLPEAGPDLPEAAPESAAVADPIPTAAVARFEGTAAPGLQIWLDGRASTGEDLRFLWVQTRGPAVQIDEELAGQARVPVLVPGDAVELAFTLVVAGRGGVDRRELVIPLQLHRSPDLPLDVVADAGDDQTAVVGHQVTLNGIRSRPRDGLAFRWIPVEGPADVDCRQESWTCTFVPERPGLYRFLLVVAADGVISEPDEVRVLASSAAPDALSEAGPPESVEALARSAAARLGGEPARVEELAVGFEDVAKRMPLYRAYEDVLLDISRRIDAVVPPAAVERGDWDLLLFEPLSERILRELRREGLDLAGPSAIAAPLTDGQEARLAEVFLAIGRGLRPIDVASGR